MIADLTVQIGQFVLQRFAQSGDAFLQTLAGDAACALAFRAIISTIWRLRATNDPSPDLYDYAQTKAATMNYVKSLAKQLGPKGIRVNAVAPGPIWTPLQVSGGASMEKLEKFGGQTPLARPGQPAELASIYVQLAAADASYATGQVYGASGGSGQP